jgi:SWI/SNF-related matrix-associated actin-dependent regulator 1 of chromatin subfamily A
VKTDANEKTYLLSGKYIVRLADDGSILVRMATYNPDLLERIKSIGGGTWLKQERWWKFPPAAASRIEQALVVNLPRPPALPESFKSSPLWQRLYPFQRENVEYFLSHRRALIADEMGLGKTLSALTCLEALSTSEKAFPALIVCPASLKQNWAREIEKWVPHRRYAILSGTTPAHFSPPDITIVNYDILTAWIDALLGAGFRAVVLDEAHMIKNSRAQRTKAARKIARCVPAVLLLTGTPILNRPVELVEPLRALGYLDSCFGGWKHFVFRYCAARPTAFGLDTRGASNLTELREKLVATCMVRHTRQQVLSQLPQQRRISIVLDLEDATAYQAAESEFISEALARPQRMKLSEALPFIAKMRLEAARAKFPNLIGWVEDLLEQCPDEKILLFAWHREIQQRLYEHFGARAMLLHSDLTTEQRQAVVDAFAGSAPRVLVASLAIGSFGFNITAASQVVFAELGWTPALHEQAESRAARIGQQKPVTAWYLLAAGTIEEDMARILDRKRVTVGAVNDGIQQELLDHLLKKFVPGGASW